MTKNFILKSLLPYKNNPELCGYDGSNCVYLTNDGKKCAIGQYMKDGIWQKMPNGVRTVFDAHNVMDIMTDEWLNENVTLAVANAMQGYHDSLARNKMVDNYYIQKLEYYTGFNLDELK